LNPILSLEQICLLALEVQPEQMMTGQSQSVLGGSNSIAIRSTKNTLKRAVLGEVNYL
jgi:hypothetical protein